MQQRWLSRLSFGLACLGIALAIAQPRDGWSRKDVFRAPEKNEKRRARLGPDSPDKALEYIMLAMRDENGNIPDNALMVAREQMEMMRTTQAQARVQAMAAGEPDPAAGITNASWTWIGPGNIGGRTRALAIHPTSTNTMFAGSVAGGIWKTTDGGVLWAPVDDFMANLAVTSIVFQPLNPSIMYASTGESFGNGDAIRGAGIFKSIDGGSTWSQLSWTASNSVFNLTLELAMSTDGSILLAATTQGMYRSIDGGASFQNVLTTAINVQDVKFLPGSSTLAVAGGVIKNAYWSNNGGQTWFLAGGMSSGAFGKRVELALSASSPNVIYASVNEGLSSTTTASEIWKSTDSGQTYSLLIVTAPVTNMLGGQGIYDNAIWVDPTNENVLIVGGVDLFRSTDGGANFSKISSWQFAPTSAHADHHYIVHDPGFNGTSNKRVYFANDGGLYKADDVSAATTGSGSTLTIPFNALNNNYGVTQFYGGSSVTNGKIFGGTQDNGTLLYTPANGPQAWTKMASGDGGFATGDQTNPNFMYAEFQWLAIHRSSNGLTSTADLAGCSKAAPFKLDDSCNETTNFIAPILLDPNNPNRLLGGGQSLWRTDDARTTTTSTTGPTWSVIKPPTSVPVSGSNNSNIAAIAIQTGNSNRIWIGHNNSDIYITDDGAAVSPTWTRVDKTPVTGGPPDRLITQISIDPFDANVAYVSFGGFSTGNVWKTTDSGNTWFNISGSGGTALPSAPVRSIVPHPSVAGWLYAGTEVGVFASTDGGATWKLPHDGPANVAIHQLFWIGGTNTLVASTHGRGMFRADVPPPATPPTILTHPTNQTVGVGSTTTLSVVGSGSAPFSYQWYQGTSGTTAFPVAGATSATFSVSPVFVATSLWVRVTNGFGTADSNTATITPQTGLASYDPSLKAPKCTVVGSACDTGPSLVPGRAYITGGPEPNQPNTINNSCTDGTSGSFHGSESLDSLKISNTGAGPMTVGSPTKIDANVWVASTTNDRLDLYGTASASSPTWTLITTLTPAPSLGAQTLTFNNYVLPAGSLQAIRGVFRSTGAAAPVSCASASTLADHDDLIFAVSPAAGIEMVTNWDFSSGSTNWKVWEAPDIVSSVVGGVFQFFLANPQTTTSKQATVFQTTGQPVVAGGPMLASFKLGNSDNVRKRISVLVLEHDFSDLSVCTFWLPANQTTLKPYTMRTHTTKGWTNAAIYFYAATSGSNGGNYLVDDVSLKYTPAQLNDRTECVDPNAPTPFSAGVGSTNMLTNGDFASGALLPGWSAVAPITAQVTSGVLEFLRPNNVTPAGNIMQTTGVSGVANQLYTATFAMGNSSNVRKRVTVLLHDLNLASSPDLTACTFWLPPNLPLSNYTMKGFATQLWANATISFYPATVGLEQWILLDNVTFSKTAPEATSGTQCVEPATITFPIANNGGGGGAGNNVKPASTTSSATQRSTVAGGALTSRKADDGPRLADDKPFSDSGSGGWNVQATATRREVLRWADPIDLTYATRASLNFMSLLSIRNSSAEVQVSRDGVTWETLAYVPPTVYWTGLDFDLSAYLGQPIYMQFVFDAVAPDSGVPPDAWRFYDAVVIIRTEKGGGG